MDAMEQALMSLKLQLPGVSAEQAERPRRSEVPSKEASPLFPNRHVGRVGVRRAHRGSQKFTWVWQAFRTLDLGSALVGLTLVPVNSVQSAVQSNATAVMGLFLVSTPLGLTLVMDNSGQVAVQDNATAVTGPVAAGGIVQTFGGGMAIRVTSTGGNSVRFGG
ncbi:hypothetical protein NDU88_005272 [Pleurodeles waltl]|uniref:Uncharacterized protein n=1 Tax=Pleurodeles waltl TaxID=8319 RepID=A0AAV7UIR1_PLEWA|nr:hypothetical protein NDU88_005272 [Pleurodeles waltl]